jgi:hypothetical protein
LRRRAYGPDADIDADPVARARLAKLEHEFAEEGQRLADRGSLHSRTSTVAPHAPVDGTSPPGSARTSGAMPVIAISASVVAALALGALLLERLEQPQSVARFEALDQVPRGTALPNLDAEDFRVFGLTAPVFVPHGEYGALDLWSTTDDRGRQCLAVSVGGELLGFHCTAPTIDTFVDVVGMNSVLPEAPEGGRIPFESTIRFVLHDDVIEVFLGRLGDDAG